MDLNGKKLATCNWEPKTKIKSCKGFSRKSSVFIFIDLNHGFGGPWDILWTFLQKRTFIFHDFIFIVFQRNIDKTRVTCIKWIPGSQTSFIAAHSSGCMYVYNYDVLCPNTVPAYQLFKQGKGFTVYTCKTKTTRNPVYKWTIGKKGSKF